MGLFFSKANTIYDQIIAELEQRRITVLEYQKDESSSLISNKNIKTFSKVFSKDAIVNPYSVKVVWKKKGSQFEKIAQSSTTEQCVFNLKTLLAEPIDIIERFIGKHGVTISEIMKNVHEEIQKEPSLSHFADTDEDGIYTIRIFFHAFLYASPGEYKIMFFSQRKIRFESAVISSVFPEQKNKIIYEPFSTSKQQNELNIVSEINELENTPNPTQNDEYGKI